MENEVWSTGHVKTCQPLINILTTKVDFCLLKKTRRFYSARSERGQVVRATTDGLPDMNGDIYTWQLVVLLIGNNTSMCLDCLLVLYLSPDFLCT